jgi:hypothetical protein
MAYSTVADIISEFKNQTFDLTSQVTSTEVTEYIVQTDAWINAELGQIYVTPITDSTDLSIVKRISIWMTKHRVQEILALRSGEALDSEDQSNLEKKANDMLMRIVDKKLLHNSTRLSSNNSGIEDFNSANNINAEFDITEGGANNDTDIENKNFW